jgi:hypothetical protein
MYKWHARTMGPVLCLIVVAIIAFSLVGVSIPNGNIAVMSSTVRAKDAIANASNSPFLPSREKPFVFFHIRKAAGSSLRTFIYESSKSHGLDAWVPCLGKWKCVPFSLPPPSEPQAVYAAHVNYAQMAQLLRETGPNLIGTTTQTFRDRNVTYHSLDDDRKEPFGSCLINIRPTVNRVESCWNYRFINKGAPKDKGWSNVMAEEWNTLLPEAVDIHGNGCNNEYARILGNTPDESLVNRISPETYGHVHYVNELETIFFRMSSCVVVRIDLCEESNKILKHFFPWMEAEADVCNIHRNSNHEIKREELTDEAKEVILSQNHFDELILRSATGGGGGLG